MKLITFGLTFGFTLLVVTSYSSFANWGRRLGGKYDDNREVTDRAAARAHKAH
jgi:hypothetical protein